MGLTTNQTLLGKERNKMMFVFTAGKVWLALERLITEFLYHEGVIMALKILLLHVWNVIAINIQKLTKNSLLGG